MTQFVATASSRASRFSRLADFAALGKPRLSFLVIFTTAVGVWLAPIPLGPLHTALFLLATSSLVAAANTLNCWIERDTDGLMVRTRQRPLPAGRLEPRVALAYGLVLGTVSLAVIAASTNGLTTLLGAAALSLYVLAYTPMKRRTPWAVVVGAVPGALPPLMGWTAATGRISTPGLFLFGILFLWQLPHFTAISLYLKDDFGRAGIRATAVVHGRGAARTHLILSLIALVAFTLSGRYLGVAGIGYAIVAAIIGAAWVAQAFRGSVREGDNVWARKMFGLSLIYLPLLITALVLDAS